MVGFILFFAYFLALCQSDCPISSQNVIINNQVCSFCKDGSILLENKFCVSKCPKDYIVPKGQIKECKKCQIQQLRVPNDERNQCVCALQYFQKPSTGQCTSCHYSCLTCIEETFQDCLSCDFNKQKLTFRQLVTTPGSLTGRCQCPSVGFYQQDSNIHCLACHPDCKTCSGPAQTDCIECNRQRIMNSFGLCQCKDGYTSISDGTCLCLNPRFQINGLCIDPLNRCGLNQIEVISNIKGNSKGNQKNATKSCQCKPGFNRVKGQCKPCGLNEEYDSKKNICSCIKQANRLNSGGCLLCDKNQRFSKEEQKCVCKNKNQELNERGECIQCPKKSIYFEGQCVCINNYFMNSKGKCQRCNKSVKNPSCRKVYDQEL